MQTPNAESMRRNGAPQFRGTAAPMGATMGGNRSAASAPAPLSNMGAQFSTASPRGASMGGRSQISSPKPSRPGGI
jgi:hypothetical protein